MSQEYLPVATNVEPSETLFPQAGDIITKKKNKFLDTSSTVLLLFKSWLGFSQVEKWEIEEEEARLELLGEDDLEDDTSCVDLDCDYHDIDLTV